ERLEPAPVDLRVRLAPADLRGEDGDVEPVGKALLLEVTPEQPARIERVGDEPEPKSAGAQSVEQGVRRTAQPARRPPGCVLCLEVARELAVRQIAEERADEGRVLDLLERAVAESGHELGAKALGELGLVGTSDRGKAVPVTSDEEF